MLNRRHQATGAQREVTAAQPDIFLLPAGERRLVRRKGHHKVSARYVFQKGDGTDKQESKEIYGASEQSKFTQSSIVRFEEGNRPKIKVVAWNGRIP
jgi:hypothetical protein